MPPEEQLSSFIELAKINLCEFKNPENVKVELEPKDEHQYKESIEIKDELVNLDNSKLTLDYPAWSEFSENEESGKRINEDVDKAPESSLEVLNEELKNGRQRKQLANNVKQHTSPKLFMKD